MDEKRLLEIIAEFTNYGAEDLKNNMEFVDDLGIDSLDLAQIVLSAESEFDLDLADAPIEDIITIGDALDLLRSQLEE